MNNSKRKSIKYFSHAGVGIPCREGINEEKFSEIWNLISDKFTIFELAGISIQRFLEIINKEKIILEPSHIWALSASIKFKELEHGIGTPPLLSEFIFDLYKDRKLTKILDPFANYGQLLYPFYESAKNYEVFGLCHTQEFLNSSKIFMPKSNLILKKNLTNSLNIDLLDGLGKFDLILSAPPINHTMSSIMINGKKTRSFLCDQLISICGENLSESGELIIFTNSGFVNMPMNTLRELGYSLEAVFELPNGILYPATSINTSLLKIKKGVQSKQIYAAKISENRETNKKIIENYVNKESGIRPELGVFVNADKFAGVGNLIAIYALQEAAKRVKLKESKLEDFIISIYAPANMGEIDSDNLNSFYLPYRALNEPIVDNFEEIKNSKLYAKIDIDPEKAEAKFISNLLRSSFGKKILASLSGSSTVPYISQQRIKKIPVWVPSLDKQRKILECESKIRLLKEEIDEKNLKLWENFSEPESILSEVKKLNNIETFSDWIDTLPFPLSSILWTVKTLEGNPLKHYLQLDFFFEALSQFLAIYVMSASQKDNVFFAKEWKYISSDLNRYKLSIRKSTVGTWVQIYSKLAKKIRSDLSDKCLREIWLERFAIDDEDFLNALLNKKLITILGKANVFRNSWRGHGGVVGDKEAEKRSNSLLDLLVEFRSLVGQKWKNYPLVTPQAGKYSKGMYFYKCSLVMGVRTPFENIDVKLKEPLEDGLLHTISPTSGNVLQLIPLVKIGNSPIKEKNACYFYNRDESEKKQVQRWISFHYEDKPEILEENKLAEDFLDSLNIN